MDTLVFIFEMVGTVAFALSGAAKAVKSNMDMLGIIVCGLTTAVGGGCIRDIILGVTPPLMFKNPVYSLVAIFTSLLIFIPFLKDIADPKNPIENIVFITMDSVGLGIFTVVGVRNAYLLYPDNIFLMVFVGALTGVGGGVLRDMFTQTVPDIFRKHIYATASVIGAFACSMLMGVNEIVAITSGVLLILVIRALSAYFKLNLPHASSDNK